MLFGTAVGIIFVFHGIGVSVEAFSRNVYNSFLPPARELNCIASRRVICDEKQISVTKGKYLTTVLIWR